MDSYVMLIAILIPIIGGALISFIPFKKRNHMLIFIEAVVILTSILGMCIIANPPHQAITIFRYTGELSVSLKLDSTGSVFALILTVLWPLATLYSFEYMKHEGHEKIMFTFYTITYGVTLGIAMAQNILTLYFFYEMLTIVTIPLVLHTLTKEAVRATRIYMYFSLGGAAFAFIGMIFILQYGKTLNFVPGGVFDLNKLGIDTNILLLVYVLCFCGFSVKAAMMPFSSWLPKAGVAPTPVTALLHAVAVVKAGAFATLRITYFSFGTKLLKGTWAQDVLMIIIIFTIVYGCSRALKETHIKRRLAWSTVSNLSYILFGIIIMTPMGLKGSLAHMVCHAVIKICSFFAAGAIMYKSGKKYIFEMDGFGKKMPIVYIIFTIASLSLMGVPGLCGFVSKWDIAKAAIGSDNIMAYIGFGAMLISAILTAIYMLTIVVRGFMPIKQVDYSKLTKVEDPNWMMLLPLTIFVVMMLVIGLWPGLLNNFLDSVVKTVF